MRPFSAPAGNRSSFVTGRLSFAAGMGHKLQVRTDGQIYDFKIEAYYL